MASRPPTGETSIGGDRQAFPSTCWSSLEWSADPGQRRAALEGLARAYWKPVYAYIRASRSASNEDAKDLTQDFFLWMAETDFLGRADPSRGRFRSFLKVALTRYLGGEDRKRRSLKRGGDRTFLFLDPTHDGDSLFELPPSEGRSPEEILDDVWKNETLGRTLLRLENEYRQEGKETQFLVFRDFCVDEATYEGLADRYGITKVDVSNFLMRAKEHFRSFLKEEIERTVSGEEHLLDEWRFLFGRDQK